MCTLTHYVTLGVINLCHLVAYTIIFLFRQATAIWFAYKKLFCKDVFWYVNIWAYILVNTREVYTLTNVFPPCVLANHFYLIRFNQRHKKFFINSKWKFLGKSKKKIFFFFLSNTTLHLYLMISFVLYFFFWT